MNDKELHRFRRNMGERIRSIRQSHAAGRREFSRTCGILPGNLTRYEQGRDSPTIPELERIAEIAGLSVLHFFARPD